MKLFIDEKEQNQKFSNEDMLGIILDKVNSDLAMQNRVCTGLTLDEIAVGDFAEIDRAQPVAKMKEIRVTSVSLHQLVIDSLKSTIDYLPRLAEGFSGVATLIQNGNHQEAMELYQKCLEGLGWFTEALGGLQRILTVTDQADLVVRTGLQGKFLTLNNLIQQLLEGFENGDWVLVGDILEYEMAAQLDEWAETLPVLVKEIEDEF